MTELGKQTWPEAEQLLGPETTTVAVPVAVLPSAPTQAFLATAVPVQKRQQTRCRPL